MNVLSQNDTVSSAEQPKTPTFNESAKYSMADYYRHFFELKLKKYRDGDRQHILTNLLTSDRYVSEFIKSVIADAEDAFENNKPIIPAASPPPKQYLNSKPLKKVD